ncbi:MAG TPA: hypothetical protein VFX02_05360 [Gammaproteobacteria bacterium]|nr:hypothetical protein [Gammaproteobacteria bacterium]
MNLNQCLLGAILVMGPSIASADAPQNYWGMGIDGFDLKENPENFDTTDNPIPNGSEEDMNGFNLRYGIWLPFDLFAIELRLGSVGEENGTLLEDPEVRYFFGVGKLNIPFETVNLYVLGGVSRVYYDIDGTESNEDDVVGGVGIELLGNETTGLTIEFLKYGVDDDPAEGKLITIGFNHRFELPGFR